MTFEKDKEDQGKYYVSYPKPPVLDMKWENRPIDVAIPIVRFNVFMDKYFTSFRLLTHVKVNKMRATRVLNKNKLRKCIITWDKQLQKKGIWQP